MFGLSWAEVAVLALLGLIIFGPDKLPTVVRDARNGLRELVTLARSAKHDLQAELGPELADLDLASLHPKRIVKDALFGDEDPNSFNPFHDGPTKGKPAQPSVPPPVLAPGARPPWDSDAT